MPFATHTTPVRANRPEHGAQAPAHRIITYRDAARFLLAAGMDLGDAPILLAIGACESGGGFAGLVVAPKPHQCVNDICYGSYQQNEGLGAQLNDPAMAAKHAVETYRASRFRYWGCGPDHGGGYQLYLAQATLAVAGIERSQKRRPKPGSKDCEARCGNYFKPDTATYRTCINALCGRKGGDVPATNLIPNVFSCGELFGHDPVSAFMCTLVKASTWIRVMEVLGGAVMIFYGVKMIGQKL